MLHTACNSSLSMFIESCEVQMSGAIVGMLQYLIQSLQKHAQNMSIQPIHRMEKKRKKKSPKFFFQSWVLQLLFNQKNITVKNAFSLVIFKKKERERKKGAVIQRESQVEMGFTVRVNAVVSNMDNAVWLHVVI